MTQASPTLGDVIRRYSPALHRQRGAAMTPAQDAVLSALGRCHTAVLGGHLYVCDHCSAEHPAYNGCGSRHCPSCQGHRSATWLDERARDLLPVPYFHVVFTVPAQISALALGNKEIVYNILLRAAAQTLLEIARDPKHLGAEIGFLAILHTWTQTLLHHPHIHCVVPGGGFAPDGSQWVPSRQSFFLSVKVLSRLFRGKFLALLEQAAQRGLLRFAGSTAPFEDPTVWKAFRRRMRRKRWVVYAKPPFGSPQHVLKYLARYTHRVAISNRRIVSIAQQRVSFRYRNRKRGNAIRTMILDGTEFLRRFLLHLLPKSFVRIRYFGFMANRVRKERLAQARALLGAPATTFTSSQPAPEICANTDADNNQPTGRCPHCKVGRLRRVRALPRLLPLFLSAPRAPPVTP